MLPNADEKEEWQREQDSSYRNPCHTKTHQKIHKLEESKYDDVFVWNWLYKQCMSTLQDPAKKEPQPQKKQDNHKQLSCVVPEQVSKHLFSDGMLAEKQNSARLTCIAG